MLNAMIGRSGALLRDTQQKSVNSDITALGAKTAEWKRQWLKRIGYAWSVVTGEKNLTELWRCWRLGTFASRQLAGILSAHADV